MFNLKKLQQAVEDSKTPEQRATKDLLARSLFLATEAAEVAKEALKMTGYYGEAAVAGARDKIGQELAQVVWNCCALATHAGIDLEEEMVTMLATNSKRTWPTWDASKKAEAK